MNQLPGKITVTRAPNADTNVIRIHVRDDEARTNFLTIELSAEDMMLALTGRAELECILKPNRLERVGLKAQQKILHIQIPESHARPLRSKDEAGIAAAKELLALHEIDGWTATVSDMFSMTRKVENCCQAVTFCRWVPKDTNPV